MHTSGRNPTTRVAYGKGAVLPFPGGYWRTNLEKKNASSAAAAQSLTFRHVPPMHNSGQINPCISYLLQIQTDAESRAVYEHEWANSEVGKYGGRVLLKRNILAKWSHGISLDFSFGYCVEIGL